MSLTATVAVAVAMSGGTAQAADDTPEPPHVEFVGPNDNDGGIFINFEQPLDTSNIAGYLVHRDYQYLAWISGANNTGYNDADYIPGQRHCYQLRSQTPDGTNSAPTDPWCHMMNA